jgi:predicted dehydrogenase
VLLTQIHQIDYLHWTFGPFDRVFAVGGHVSDLDIDVEDCVSYLLRSTSGIPVRAHLDYLQRPKRAGVTVTGTAGRLAWDYHRNSLSFTPPELDATTHVDSRPFDRNQMFTDLLADFLDAVRCRRAPRTTLADAARVLAVVDAIKTSMATGEASAVAGDGS